MTHTLRLLLAPLAALCVLTSPVDAAAADGSVEILSVVGAVRSGGAVVAAGQHLPGNHARPALVVVPRGASLTALLTARGRPQALSAAGPLLLRLLGPGSDVVRLEGDGSLRLAGHDATLRATGWNVKLGVSRLSLTRVDGVDLASFLIERDAWSTIVLDGDQLYVLEGSVLVTPGRWPLGRLLSLLAPAPPPPFLLGAPQHACLELSRAVRGQGPPPPEVLQRLAVLETPPAWVPDAGRVTPAEVKRARRQGELQRQAAREAASCGCTESRGSAGQWSSSRSVVNPLERTSGVFTVRVKGMPRGLP
jgi:hypothetical protein